MSRGWRSMCQVRVWATEGSLPLRRLLVEASIRCRIVARHLSLRYGVHGNDRLGGDSLLDLRGFRPRGRRSMCQDLVGRRRRSLLSRHLLGRKVTRPSLVTVVGQRCRQLVSTDYADTMSAVVKFAEEIDESVRHGPITSSCDKVLRAVLSCPSRPADCGMPMLCLSRWRLGTWRGRLVCLSESHVQVPRPLRDWRQDACAGWRTDRRCQGHVVFYGEARDWTSASDAAVSGKVRWSPLATVRRAMLSFLSRSMCLIPLNKISTDYAWHDVSCVQSLGGYWRFCATWPLTSPRDGSVPACRVRNSARSHGGRCMSRELMVGYVSAQLALAVRKSKIKINKRCELYSHWKEWNGWTRKHKKQMILVVFKGRNSSLDFYNTVKRSSRRSWSSPWWPSSW